MDLNKMLINFTKNSIPFVYEGKEELHVNEI